MTMHQSWGSRVVILLIQALDALAARVNAALKVFLSSQGAAVDCLHLFGQALLQV